MGKSRQVTIGAILKCFTPLQRKDLAAGEFVNRL
jgi:hypothetical protein